ncbi:hypothetical protein D9M69_453230 [compost metagenome]
MRGFFMGAKLIFKKQFSFGFSCGFVAFCGLVFVLPIWSVVSSLSWHDQQRLGQIFLVGLASLWVFSNPKIKRLDFSSFFLLLGILVLGFFSSSLARQSLWAFSELAVFVGCYFMVCAVRDWRAEGGKKIDMALFGVLVSVVAAILLKFFISFSGAIIIRGPIDSLLLFDGFSWPRFLGQFQTLSLPLLTIPFFLKKKRHSWCIILCALWWFATIAVGTRASWLGMACAVLFVLLFFESGRKFAFFQVSCALVGLVIYKLLMVLVPWFFDLPVGNLAEDRLSLSMSGREVLWSKAWGMFLENPWFGAGPMSFAGIASPLGAHPHQAILQWMSEWGGVSALLVILLLGRSAWIFYLQARKAESGESSVLEMCLMGSFIASAVHAMFDGSLVMPYTQIWLSILIGWAWGVHSEQCSDNQGSVAWSHVMLPVLVSLLLVFVVVRDIPQIIVESRQDQSALACWREAPRFWYNGIIKEDPKFGCASLAPKK